MMMDSGKKESRAEPIPLNLSAIWTLLRVKNQYGTLLVLIPALWSLFIASEGRPDPVILFIVILGAFFMRSAGCAINDIADRNFDPHVKRTKERPLAAGKLTPARAFIIFLLAVLAAALLTLYLNPLAVVLSVVCLFLVILYPFTKRFISFPQLFLGIAFGWGAVIVWAAVRDEVALTACLIFFATVTWAVAYDTVYAMMDIDDDRRIGIKSTAIFFGRFVRPAVATLFVSTIATLISIGLASGLGAVYFASLAVCGFIFLRQVYHTEAGMKKDVAFSCFKSNVAAGCIVLAGIALDYFV